MTTRRRMPGPATEWRVGARVPFNSLLTRLPIEVSGVEAPQHDDFVKSLKNKGLRKDTGPFLLTTC